jgi:hypothetical protein
MTTGGKMDSAPTEPRRWFVLVSFYADTPTDANKADAHADRITDEVTAALYAFPYVITGSVKVHEADTLAENATVLCQVVR